jgi:hypothetical protein
MKTPGKWTIYAMALFYHGMAKHLTLDKVRLTSQAMSQAAIHLVNSGYTLNAWDVLKPCAEHLLAELSKQGIDSVKYQQLAVVDSTTMWAKLKMQGAPIPEITRELKEITPRNTNEYWNLEEDSEPQINVPGGTA